ncbi:MAG: cytochrome c family protein [Woeseiaceae bacterium]|nr:cytochrome c family protein [Woeseiaceae bacterium]
MLTAATLGEQVVLSNADQLASAPYNSADTKNGAAQARLCRACHTLESGGMNMLGPNLHGFFGKRVGTVEGFGYSNALLAADFVWTPRALDAWLQRPAAFLPGNMMAFGGIRDPQDRVDLIAYLLEETNDEGEQQQ